MNRKNGWIVNHDSLLEGCYHEMGHILATLYYFPNDERIRCISFSKQQKGCFKFNTNYNDYQWSLPRQLDAFIMFCVGGGVFQQMMKVVYGRFKKFSVMNVFSRIGLYFNRRKYLIKHVQCPYKGMEERLVKVRVS